MNGLSTVLIVLGLFLLGGVISVLSIGAAMCIVVGAMYWK
jgi:hypothetical protein